MKEYKEIFHLEYYELLFCFICFFIALFLCSLATPLGPSISPDSVMYINVGENLYSGNGFVQGYGDEFYPYTHQIFYPILIATGMHFGFTSEQAAGIIPGVCFALLMFPLFILGKFISRPLTGYVTCIICLLSPQLLRIATFAWTDMPYLFFSSIVILLFAIYWKYNKIDLILFAGFLTALVTLTKYSGVILICVGLVTIMFKNWKNFKTMAVQSITYGFISILPLALWLLANQSLGYTIGRNTRMGGLLTTISVAINSVVFDLFLVPYSSALEKVMPVLTLVLVVLLAIFIIIFVKWKETLLIYLKTNFPLIAYIFIYAGVLVLVTSSLGIGVLGGVLDTRKLFVIFPFLIMLIISAFILIHDKLDSTSLKLSVKRLLIICFIIFTILQVNHTVSYINYSRSPHFWGFNSLDWEKDPAVCWIKDNNLLINATIYSDRNMPLRFQLKRSIKQLPNSNLSLSYNETQIENFFKELKNKKIDICIYICIYLKDWHRPDYISNEDILDYNSKYNVLVKVVEFPNTIIYKTK